MKKYIYMMAFLSMSTFANVINIDTGLSFGIYNNGSGVHGISGVPVQHTAIIDDYQSGRVGVGEVFEYAVNDGGTWFLNSWLKKAPSNSELHGVYLVIKTGEMKHKVLNEGDIKSYHEFIALASSDDYVKSEFDVMEVSNSAKLIDMRVALLEVYAAKDYIDKYNTGNIEYAEIIELTKSNKVLAASVKGAIKLVVSDTHKVGHKVVFGPEIIVIE